MKLRLCFLIAMVVFSGCAGEAAEEGPIEVPENPETPVPPPPPPPPPALTCARDGRGQGPAPSGIGCEL